VEAFLDPASPERVLPGGVPKDLGGIYRRLLQQVEDKEQLASILQWAVLAARPMTVNELAVAADIKASDTLTPAEILNGRLASCGLLVKIDVTIYKVTRRPS
jgi:predicted transcriptional regulator